MNIEGSRLKVDASDSERSSRLGIRLSDIGEILLRDNGFNIAQLGYWGNRVCHLINSPCNAEHLLPSSV
jgi:hypothetical protein